MLMSKERLDKVLANNGVGTRKTVRPLITRGRVCVNGETVRSPDAKVDASCDSISVDGEKIKIRTTICLMMNKPSGYICSTKEGCFETVFDLLPEDLPRSYLDGDLGIVGRLDADTEGLLLLTSSGELNHKLCSPKHHVPKTYFVRLSFSVSKDDSTRYQKKLQEGIFIAPCDGEDGWNCLPATIQWTDLNSPKPECLITVHEGKYHEIKRMFSALGNTVEYLKRVKIGSLALDESLAPGAVRELSPEDLKALFE